MQRTSNRDKLNFKYSLFAGNGTNYKVKNGIPVVSYVASDGTNVYEESGEPIPTYLNPIPFKSSIAMSGGDADSTEYGLSIADYEATLIFPKGAYPITEGSLIWKDSEPKFKYLEDVAIETENGTVYSKAPIKSSADYTVIKVSDSINLTKVILKRVNK